MGKGEKNNAKLVEIILTKIGGRENNVIKSFVVPGHTRVRRGETINFSALETGVRLIFPNKNLFGTHELEFESGESKCLTVSKQVERGIYAYAVITKANNDLASGGSFPRFIVE